MPYPGDVRIGNTIRKRLISFVLLSIESLEKELLTEGHPRDDLAHGSIQVLQHAEIVFLTLGLLEQLLDHARQLGVCDVGTERLRMR